MRAVPEIDFNICLFAEADRVPTAGPVHAALSCTLSQRRRCPPCNAKHMCKWFVIMHAEFLFFMMVPQNKRISRRHPSSWVIKEEYVTRQSVQARKFISYC